LKDAPGFAETYLADGAPPRAGSVMTNTALGGMLERLADAGLDDYYRGDVARANAAWLEKVGSPLRAEDFAAQKAKLVEPLSARLAGAVGYNMPPPTQGVSSLMILSIFERLGIAPKAPVDGVDYLHGLVEATKQAFILRNEHLTDLDFMDVDPREWLSDAVLDDLAGKIDPAKALPWPYPPKPGDTIWMGAADKDGRVVSFIQSIYWEFGSGVVAPETGVLFQNRGHGFSTDPAHPNRLEPGKRPFHTLNPAMAVFDDGRVMSYGTMGGEGQPQTQSALYTRYVHYGVGLQRAVTAPRWLLGRTWGEETMTLKLESRFDEAVVEQLRARGHAIDLYGEFDNTFGHAGAIVRHASGLMEGASDPRSDGAVAAC
jgi:gamma-glutamyltranspeptidase/glutathione hydrolase